MLTGQAWRWIDADDNTWELLVEYDGDNRCVWLGRDDSQAAKVLFSRINPDGREPWGRRFDPWPREVAKQFYEVVDAQRKAVQK